jgi:hypothetical protein
MILSLVSLTSLGSRGEEAPVRILFPGLRFLAPDVTSWLINHIINFVAVNWADNLLYSDKTLDQ